MTWANAAKAIGGLATVLTLLAHFWIPELPLTVARVQLLLLLIGVLLGIDVLTERFPYTLELKSRTDSDNDDTQS